MTSNIQITTVAVSDCGLVVRSYDSSGELVDKTKKPASDVVDTIESGRVLDIAHGEEP